MGFEQFAIVGHDRGSYTAYRAALDYPEKITSLAVLDCVPILEALERYNEKFARQWYHWFFFAQPEKLERVISNDPDAWYGGKTPYMVEEEYENFRKAIHDPATVHTMLEDYRAALSIDRLHEEEDRQFGRKIHCPVLCLWSEKDDLAELYRDIPSIWQNWANNVQTGTIKSCHHMAEEAQYELYERLKDFLLK